MDSVEFRFLRQYFSYYRQSDTQLTAFGPWHYAAWNFPANGYPDNGYFRAICNTAVVGAIVKRQDPANVDVSWTRLKALVMAVVAAYKEGPGGKPGWGFWPGDTVPGRQLHPTTGFIGYPCALAAALLWQGDQRRQEGFSLYEKELIRATLRDLAERLCKHRPPSYYAALQSPHNSTTEEASGDAAFLAVMSQFDRSYAASARWLANAQAVMQWAFDNFNTRGANLGGAGVPSNEVNQHPYAYEYTATNHQMYPHPHYGLSVVNDAAAALVPWSAQGVTVARQTSGIAGISTLFPGSGSGNEHLYGGSVARWYTVYNANVVFVKGASHNAIPAIQPGSDFSFWGRTYNSRNHQAGRDFGGTYYLGRSGVSDWGCGADFHNAAFACGAWFDESYYPTLGTGYYNYQTLLAYQTHAPGLGYLPTTHPAPCGSPAQEAGWRWGFLPQSCNGSQPSDMTRPLVNFFLSTAEWPPLTLSGQINTHFFLNSYGALNHAIAYLTRGAPFWPRTGDGSSTLPDFGR